MKLKKKPELNDFQRAVAGHIRKMIDNYKMPRIEAVPAPAEFFKEMPIPDGSFEWIQEEAGDWIAYQCEDPQCTAPGGWHKKAHGMDIGRKDGKLWVESWTLDEDGSRNTIRWDEGENDEDWFKYAIHQNQVSIDEYFQGWAAYYLWCAEQGQDPLNEAMGKIRAHAWVNYWLEFALENIALLYMNFENEP